MISAPNAYFTTEEARQAGAVPKFLFCIFPHYLQSGATTGGGTFTNCSWVAPDTILADYARNASASWESPAQDSNLSRYPTATIITWVESQGAFTVAVKARWSSLSADLAAASYNTLTSGTSYDLLRYYQVKVEFTGRRCWAPDTDDSNAVNAYATDDGTGEYASYAVQGPVSDSLVEDLVLETEYPVPESDVISAGELSLDRSADFSDITAADHTLTLNNNHGRYSSRVSNFLFAGENWWYRKSLRIDFGYLRPGSDNIFDTITLYEGLILKWGPNVQEVDQSGTMSPQTVEIYSRDHAAILLEKNIGSPDADGNPQPLIYGTILAEAQKIADDNPEVPYKSIYFEGNNLTELDSSAASGGTITTTATDPFAGSYCCATSISGANDYAYGILYLYSASTDYFVTLRVKFTTIDTTPTARNMKFLRLYDGSETLKVEISLLATGKLEIKVNTDYEETDFLLAGYEDLWVRLSIAWHGDATNGFCRVWIEGDEILNKEHTSAAQIKQLWFGLQNGAVAESWAASWDNIQIWPSYYDKFYQIPGSPFSEIADVYVDGARQMVSSPVAVSRTSMAGGKGWPIYSDKFVSGTQKTSSFTKYPAWGAVQYAGTDDPSGTVMVRAVKDTTDHPVQVMSALITEAGLSSRINTASFNTAQTANPDDVVGCYFEDVQISDAVADVCGKCLYDFFLDQGAIKLKAYTGTLGSSVLTITGTEISSANQTYNMDEIKNSITSKWGWYERNKRLFYTATDSDSIAIAGTIPEEINLSWGEGVASESRTMAKNKADLLLQRFSDAQETWEVIGNLKLARLELGDVVTLNLADLLDTATDYEVFSKRVLMDDKQVELTLQKFMGEN